MSIQLGFAVSTKNADFHLGHSSPNWSDWDGGKIGGRPSWLNPRDLPQNTLRCRGPCQESSEGGTPLCFVTQLYCPADDINENAFHRTLYVFACPRCCSGSSELMKSVNGASTRKDDELSASKKNLSDCIQVLRCQLPKTNDFYPTRGDGNDAWDKHTGEYWVQHENDEKLNTCAVCGQRSKGKCPKQNKWFCCPDHQKEHLRAGKKIQMENLDTQDIPIKHLSSVYFESELVVEEEPMPSEQATENDIAQKTSNSLFQSEKNIDTDLNLEQTDLNAMTLSEATRGVTDPTTLAFYARMAIGGKENDVRDQCLRYSRWPENEQTDDETEEDDERNVGPLWLASPNQPPHQFTNKTDTTFPPPCQHCGSPRSFEFQILPQMLHYLNYDPDSTNDKNRSKQVLSEVESAILLEAASKIQSGVELPPGFREQHEKAVTKARKALLGISSDENENSKDEIHQLEWGTIAIYTCTNSCGDGDAVSLQELKNLDATEKERLGNLGAYREEVAWMQPPLE